MSYYRPAVVSEVLEWLDQFTNNGVVEVDAIDLAAALVGQWELVGAYPTQ